MLSSAGSRYEARLCTVKARQRRGWCLSAAADKALTHAHAMQIPEMQIFLHILVPTCSHTQGIPRRLTDGVAHGQRWLGGSCWQADLQGPAGVAIPLSCVLQHTSCQQLLLSQALPVLPRVSACAST